MKKVTEKCGAIYVSRSGTYVCQLPAGHCQRPNQKHMQEGAMWTQAGADRVARELAAEAAAKQQQPE